MHLTTSSFLLLTLLLTPSRSLAFTLDNPGPQELVSIWTSLDHNSPEYRKCLETDCAKYLNMHAVCDALKGGWNYTTDPEVEKENYLNCVCEEETFLEELENCEKCTGETTLPGMKSECAKRNPGSTPDDDISTSTTSSPTTTQTTPPEQTQDDNTNNDDDTNTGEENQDDNGSGAPAIDARTLGFGWAGMALGGWLVAGWAGVV